MAHEDEAVKPVKEEPSRLVAEAQLRHQNAENDLATPQEKKQAEVEKAHALSTRPDGSYAQLHETEEPTLAIADEAELRSLQEQQDEAIAKLSGEDVQADADTSKSGKSAKAADAKAADSKGADGK